MEARDIATAHRIGYAICTTPRSGSNWAGQLLSSTDRLGYPLEYFNGPGRRIFTDPDYPDEPSRQIDRILTTGTSPNGVYALKVFPQHLDTIRAEVRWTRCLPDLRYVYLERRDILAQAISFVRATATGRYRSTQKPDEAPQYDGAKILQSLHSIVRDQAKWRAYFARNGIRPLTVAYEEIVTSPQHLCDQVAHLVEIDTPPTIAFDRVDLRIQRDQVSLVWRRRFIEDHADLDRMDDL